VLSNAWTGYRPASRRCARGPFGTRREWASGQLHHGFTRFSCMFRAGTERRPQRAPQGFKPRYCGRPAESPSPHRRWAVSGARGRACACIPRWVRGDELDESTQPSSNAPIDGRQAECASAIGSHWTDLNPDRLRARWRPQRLLSAVATNGIRLDAGSGRGVPRRCVA